MQRQGGEEGWQAPLAGILMRRVCVCGCVCGCVGVVGGRRFLTATNCKPDARQCHRGMTVARRGDVLADCHNAAYGACTAHNLLTQHRHALQRFPSTHTHASSLLPHSTCSPPPCPLPTLKQSSLSTPTHPPIPTHRCNSLDSCCESYEVCVSCCLAPANKPDERRREAPRWSSNPEDSRVWSDAFEYCMATCRSHRGSTSHENAYIGPRHHCFSKLGKPMVRGASVSVLVRIRFCISMWICSVIVV